MGEGIYAPTMPDAANFTLVRSGGTAPTVQSVAGIPTTAVTADAFFTLTLSAAPASGDTLSYTQSSTGNKVPRDVAGNKLAAFTAQAITAAATLNAPTGLDLAATDDTGASNTDNTHQKHHRPHHHWLCEGGQHGVAV